MAASIVLILVLVLVLQRVGGAKWGQIRRASQTQPVKLWERVSRQQGLGAAVCDRSTGVAQVE
jgi:hypothetical protein